LLFPGANRTSGVRCEALCPRAVLPVPRLFLIRARTR